MSLKARLRKVEADMRQAGADYLPVAIIMDDEVRVAGEVMTLEEYEARYRPLIEAAKEAGTDQAFFAINFTVVNSPSASSHLFFLSLLLGKERVGMGFVPLEKEGNVLSVVKGWRRLHTDTQL